MSAGTRLAILGADGFIGNALVRAALAAGTEVTAISIKRPWRLAGIESSRLERIPVREGRWWVPRDDAYVAALARADSLALLAYTPPPSGARDRLRHERALNVDGAQAVAKLAAEAGVHVVFASSAYVYGHWHDRPIREAEPPEPQSPYSVAKLEAERALQKTCNATCLRIATVYGPGENGPRAIPSFIRAFASGEAPEVHGDGSDVHDYVYADDVATAILSAADGAPGRIYNVGTGIGRQTIDVLRAVAHVMDRPPSASYVPTERSPSRLVLDTSEARRELGFRPRVGFEAGLREEVRWLQDRLAA